MKPGGKLALGLSLGSDDFLRKQAARIPPSKDDVVLDTIYEDSVTGGRIVTMGEVVLAGTDTLARHPACRDFPIHFRKSYTEESHPVKRGETPKVEFEQTQRCLEALPASVIGSIRPLGHEPLIYRSRIILGATYESLSATAEGNYKSVCAHPITSVSAAAHLARTDKAYACITECHRSGVAHGDLHLGNILWTHDKRAQLIDLAAPVFRSDVTSSEWQNAVDDDLVEILREAALLQLNQKTLLPGECCAKAVTLADELLPDEFATKLLALPPVHQPRPPLPTPIKQSNPQHSL